MNQNQKQNQKYVTNSAPHASHSKESRKITFGAFVFFSTVFVAVAISVFFVVNASQTTTGPLAFFSVTRKIPRDSVLTLDL
jgi:dihydroorotase